MIFSGRTHGGVLPTLGGKLIVAVLAAMLIPLVFHRSHVFSWQFAAVGDIDCNDTGKTGGRTWTVFI